MPCKQPEISALIDVIINWIAQIGIYKHSIKVELRHVYMRNFKRAKPVHARTHARKRTVCSVFIFTSSNAPAPKLCLLAQTHMFCSTSSEFAPSDRGIGLRALKGSGCGFDGIHRFAGAWRPPDDDDDGLPRVCLAKLCEHINPVAMFHTWAKQAQNNKV